LLLNQTSALKARRSAARRRQGNGAATRKSPWEDESPVLVERCAGYRVITLNRRSSSTLSTKAMHQALKRALSDAEEDSDCRALMLTGAGRAFCSGQDLRERISKDGKTTVLGSALETYYNPLVRKLRALPFPGGGGRERSRRGAGANIALACDVGAGGALGQFRAVFRQDRPGAGFRRHLVLAPPGRPAPRARDGPDRRPASRGQGRSLGPDLENAWTISC
jgi:hypothetical protein